MDYREVYNRGVELYPDREAIIDGDRRFTWREWGERQRRLSNALLGLGLQKGDRVCLLLKNCAEYMDAYAAGARTGIVIIPLNFRLPPETICDIVEETRSKAVIVHQEFVSTFTQSRERLPNLKTVVAIGGEAPGCLEYERLLASASTDDVTTSYSDDDLAVVIYTTGTTGKPKGAMATRRIMMARLTSVIMELGFVPEDRWLNAMPIFHIAVIETIGISMRCGTNVILRDFDPQAFCCAVEQEKVTKTFLTPATIAFVLNLPELSKFDLTSLRTIFYGAAPMPLDTLKRMAKAVPNCDFVQGYGTSECWALVYLSAKEHKEALCAAEGRTNKLGSIGRKGLMADIKVVDEEGRLVKPGEVGEILMRSSAIMSGYLGRPEETSKSIIDGWFQTKDLATVDADGYLYLVDRKNHMIITGGENVYPAQIENVLFDHPSIAEAAIIGVPDPKWGEAVKALVVLQPGKTMTEAEVIAFCAPRMANYAKPKQVEFVAELPHTATGKVDKLTLRKAHWEKHDRMIG